MNSKSLSILALIALSVITATTLLIQKNHPPLPTHSQLFPNLTPILPEITQINISRASENFTMNRDEQGQWRLQEKQNYSVDTAKVHKLLIGIAELTVLEPKTSNPESYSKLGVEDISQANAQSTLITFNKANKETVASLIVGKERTAKTDTTLKEFYVRQPQEKQALLTRGQFELEKTMTNWLNQQIIDLNSNHIHQVQITPAVGEPFVVTKDAPSKEDFQLADLPANASLKEAYTLKNIAATLSQLSFNDVFPADKLELNTQETTQAIFTTFDGLKVTMSLNKKDNKYYAKFAAAFDAQAVWVEPSKDATSSKEEKKELSGSEKATPPAIKPSSTETSQLAEKLNAQFNGWIYELVEYKVDQLLKKRSELIEVKSEPQDELGTPTTTVP